MSERSAAELARLSDDLAGMLPGARPPAAVDFHRGPLTHDHEVPSPGSQPGNSPVPPTSDSGHDRYKVGRQANAGNQAQNRADHTDLTGRVASQPAPTRLSPTASLGTVNVPQSRAAALTGCAPGERG
jgi:hypothetical protein